ncbi:4'-phosphopantetheinyl transferase family protein [Streptomyces brevispora]|uniref:4'-phosphopantetheinyl transferase EntD n=1 Tax=Streptomyces brevispora TaxID=887462 RepID=A0A561V2F9_9ACTN|nr:4'-phosphopantetheinyl transferase superfamily protein [Streptomyces brevispora]TWG05791.1 4'-phosphopantetheinyl transferase EntD [Streptomyces brevispora]WSC13225.1 4'-phosphopantetheinyl transferase superfamily protein [Streptomyces brevispora]
MIAAILPPDVAAVSTFGDLSPTRDRGLFPAEAAAVAQAVARRRAEFTTVRLCARRAMAELGLPPAPLLSGKRGAINWPDGVTGSMTHCPGFRAAAIARTEAIASLGIDAEPNLPLPDGVLEVISLPRERAGLAELSRRRPDVHWDRLLFSAKESVFKTWYPLTRRELDFTEAELDFDPAGTFSARLLVPGPELAGRRHGAFSGRWTVGRGFVLTAIALPA